MQKFALISIAASGLVAACSISSPPPPRPAVYKFPTAKVVEAVPKLVGIIYTVNTDGQFVLIESNQSAALAPGTALKCFRDGVESGVVALSRERRGSHVTADIVLGEPQRGDQVFE